MIDKIIIAFIIAELFWGWLGFLGLIMLWIRCTKKGGLQIMPVSLVSIGYILFAIWIGGGILYTRELFKEWK